MVIDRREVLAAYPDCNMVGWAEWAKRGDITERAMLDQLVHYAPGAASQSSFFHAYFVDWILPNGRVVKDLPLTHTTSYDEGCRRHEIYTRGMRSKGGHARHETKPR